MYTRGDNADDILCIRYIIRMYHTYIYTIICRRVIKYMYICYVGGARRDEYQLTLVTLGGYNNK